MNNSIDNSVNSQLELNFKVLIIGNYNIGKTSILTRYTKDEFSEQTAPTLGISFTKKEVEWKGLRIFLELWDTAGQERFRTLTPLFFWNTHAALVIYDITQYKTFQDC